MENGINIWFYGKTLKTPVMFMIRSNGNCYQETKKTKTREISNLSEGVSYVWTLLHDVSKLSCDLQGWLAFCIIAGGLFFEGSLNIQRGTTYEDKIKKYKVTVSAALTEKTTVIQARHHKRFWRFVFRATKCGVFINIVFAETKRWEVTYLERSKRVPWPLLVGFHRKSDRCWTMACQRIHEDFPLSLLLLHRHLGQS